jgi:hypothetical protein
MTEQARLAPTPDWDELRHYNEQIAEQSKDVPYLPPACAIAVNAWDSGTPDIDSEAEFDTTGYLAERTEATMPWRRTIFLSMFSLIHLNTEGVAHVFELNLTPNNERLLTYTVYTKLLRYGVSRASETETFELMKQKEAADRIGHFRKAVKASLSHPDEYEVVREQLERGASGGYTRI